MKMVILQENIIFIFSFCNKFGIPLLIYYFLVQLSARKAVEVGIAGIVVSNHGGRQLDHSPATISVLEEVYFFSISSSLKLLDFYFVNLACHRKSMRWFTLTSFIMLNKLL